MKRMTLIQSRLSSARYPGKMLENVAGAALVEFVYRRCMTSKMSPAAAVITSTDESDDLLADYCISRNIPVFRGPLDNVLARYVDASDHFGCEIICRVCGDTPFVDTEMIDRCIGAIENDSVDYAAPDRAVCAPGFYSETVKLSALKRALAKTSRPEDLEHVTKYILDHRTDFSVRLFDDKTVVLDRSVRFTVDYPEDMILVNRLACGLGKFDFTSEEVKQQINNITGAANVRNSRL